MKPANRLLLAVVFALPAQATAADCDTDFADVFRDVSPSVVQVYAVSIDPFSLMHRVQHGVGTGFVVDDDGHVVTNAHLVYGAGTIMIATHSDEMLPAEIVGVDPLSDLAVIKLRMPLKQLEKAALGASVELEIGDEVLAVGYPFGIGKTATRGIVSGMERVMPFSTWSWMTPLVQTDAAINPGNSGGPLVNRCGEVIAVNTIGSTAAQNINFSIPIDTVREYLPQLIEHGRIIRPWHGINGVIVPMPMVFSFGIPPGYMIETIEPGSPAEEIGLRGGNFPVVIGNNEYLLGGDVISEVNGIEVTDMDTVFEIARSLRVGDAISIRYYRDGMLQTAEVELPERPILPGDTLRFRSNSHGQ
ncbi:MAG: trypsin-like serine protease [Woeseiaceae bacterium]|nr:trypsin-like serine protease [Woeseiaceae bacterium]NIP21969.1 trypsin-like serine protease [Woeseiaceae bacterium]NIS91093.1 trypsin-like serine protease [Woeseiaceae bacterium]